MGTATCTICGGDYNENRFDEHCCGCFWRANEIERLRNELEAIKHEAETNQKWAFLEWRQKAKDLEQERDDAVDQLQSAIRLSADISACQKDAEHLRELLTVLWVSQGKHQRDTWDAKAVAAFDAAVDQAMKEQTT